MMAVIGACCNGFASEARADAIVAFFQKHPVPQATRKVSQIVENTRANAGFLRRVEGSKKLRDVLAV